MSTVDKMLIKGIRAFDPENKHVITFFRPLTLIVGPNGAGKTTIIECLKLSCTGELPPNARSGHSFVHDPKVAGETETKGQIKLRFKTAAGKDVVCIRSFQLTQKTSKMEYKAIESVLQTINPHTGEKVCLSYRCADMDREIPALMGVSKAVLENVIFVHQDEANWPLQDPSTLKKKFDDIFSATRYTKALEIIKKLHKDQAQEIKTYKLKLENLQTLKDAAYKLRESIAEDQKKTELLKSQIEEIENNIRSLDAKIQNTESTRKVLEDQQNLISNKKTERSTLLKEKERQYNALEVEIDDSDEDLRRWNSTAEAQTAALKSKICKWEREKEEIAIRAVVHKDNINKRIQEISKLQTEAEACMSLKKERDATIQRLYEMLNLGTLPDVPFSNEVALNLTNCIELRLEDCRKDLEDQRESNKKEIQVVWELYNAATDRWKDVQAQQNAKREIKNGNIKRIEEKEKERYTRELQISDVDLVHIDEREKQMGIDVARKIMQLEQRNFKTLIEQAHLEIVTSTHQLTTLNREKDIMAADSADRRSLSDKKNVLENNRKKHRKIIDEFKDRIRVVLKGRFPPEKDVKKEVIKALRALELEHDDLHVKSREAEMEVNMLQMKKEEAENHLSQLHKDRDSRKRFLESKLKSLDQQTASIDLYLEVLDRARAQRDDKKSKYNMAEGMRQMFDPFERVARAHHMCPCCERSFSAEEEDDFVKKQRVKATNSVERIKALATECTHVDSSFQQLEKLRIVYEEYTKLWKETIPLAEKNLNKLSAEMDIKSQSLDDVLGVLAQIKADKDSVEVLVQPVETADKIFHDIQAQQNEVDDLEAKFDIQGQDTKSMEDIQAEINTLQKKIDNLHNERERLHVEQSDMEGDLHRLQLRWADAREVKVKASSALTELKKIEAELEHLAEEQRQINLEEKHVSEALGPLLKEKQKLLNDYDVTKESLERRYEEQDKCVRSYEMEFRTLLNQNSKIKEYNELKKLELLNNASENKAVLDSQLQNCNTRVEEISAELSKSNELLQNQAGLKRNIQDNLHYRITKQRVDELGYEIELMEEKIAEMGGVSKFEAEVDKLKQERDRFSSESNRYLGTVSVHQSNISKNKIDLKQAQYKDIDKRYFDQMIQLKTTEMANKDLDRYYNALDKALMRFHTMKMEEINKIIRELWQQTYRGQDIDYISIHSDSEGAGTRSYSYKLLMQTGDAELEMRGRCSAGQKVLASLIIRLALAETFCLNCGILALDEPTTNLDGPNAESLAAALLRIMEDRKGQENFQLIVITHDERFAQLIGQRQHAEKYYRITKDDHQHSIIEAQEIFE
ncbi:DNA repair protein RAD50 [Daucus carota subsp. sativus]|uniref:DNA repair protein RAD50 n=1 Tax=Daucus carota subsp. sativus TaxID=79200 RepID=UPI0007F04690|nr:PREDICTED: DNA repair protein RAD50 [Daucus carota subsp. sativus]